MSGRQTRKAAAGKADKDQERELPEPSPIPARIYAQASPRSVGGVSMFDAQQRIDAGTVANFFSSDELVLRAAQRLQDAGFEILQVMPTMINIAGDRETYERAFGTTIVNLELPAMKPQGEDSSATFLDSPDTALLGLISTAGTRFDDVLEGVALEVPRYFMSASAFAPTERYWHLQVPGDIAAATNAERAHRGGITGRGVRAVMVDSGHFAHPYFATRGYRVAPVVLGPGASNAAADESGHGTGESANLLAIAPDVDFTMVKMSFVNTTAAFNAAVALGPHVISCSWGSSIPFGPLSAADQALAAAIATAVATGIIVVFSAGNGHAGFPGQHPDVISAGGAFMNPDGSLNASNYASGFMSTIYANRRVPDLSGLVGMRPRAMYIMLPVEPGDDIDTDLSGGTHPNGDQTANNDGWAAFSGTSAAAPQLAGVAALVRQACGQLPPAAVRQIMMNTARDVTAGQCNAVDRLHNGLAAGTGPDTATGNGLVDAHRAVMVAKVRCLGPLQPMVLVQPVQPLTPVTPFQAIPPIIPVAPVGPADTSLTGAPAAQPPPGLSQEDIQTLEDMISRGEIDLDM